MASSRQTADKDHLLFLVNYWNPAFLRLPHCSVYCFSRMSDTEREEFIELAKMCQTVLLIAWGPGDNEDSTWVEVLEHICSQKSARLNILNIDSSLMSIRFYLLDDMIWSDVPGAFKMYRYTKFEPNKTWDLIPRMDGTFYYLHTQFQGHLEKKVRKFTVESQGFQKTVVYTSKDHTITNHLSRSSKVICVAVEMFQESSCIREVIKPTTCFWILCHKEDLANNKWAEMVTSLQNQRQQRLDKCGVGNLMNSGMKILLMEHVCRADLPKSILPFTISIDKSIVSQQDKVSKIIKTSHKSCFTSLLNGIGVQDLST